MTLSESDVTRLLKDWSEGDAVALESLKPLVFGDLRQIARPQLMQERADHTLQPTALVNEVYLRLYGQRSVHWESRGQFYSFAAMLMRRILVDHAKSRLTAKRGKGVANLPLDEEILAPEQSGIDIIALDEALSRLAEFDERMSRIVELRFFIDLSNEEIAEVVGLSLTSVKREWRAAKLWLFNEMSRT